MVRLKFWKKDWNEMSDLVSQFHYGSIEIFNVCIYQSTLSSLNSIMVRLKYEGGFRECDDIVMRSQFHYGSIEIVGSSNGSNNSDTVSIPLWFD